MLRTDVLVIGAGQAGLATAYALKATGSSFLLVDAGEAVGDSWRNRYDGLKLFTPRSISSLPGMSLPGAPNGYATKDEFADYLERYSVNNSLDVIGSTRVARLRRKGAQFEALLSDGRNMTSDAVIVATGAFAVPRIPAFTCSFPSTVAQVHVSEFRSSNGIVAGTVLVVGDGASGRDIAAALSGSHSVLLAQGRKRRLLPETILGRSVWWWLDRLGLLRASAAGYIGKWIRKADPFPGRCTDDTSLLFKGVVLKSRLVAVNENRVTFEDGSDGIVDAVVWATGYVDDLRWIEIDGAVDERGAAIHHSGVSPVDGLYYIGRPWQRNRASGLVMGVGDDAAFVVSYLRNRSLLLRA